MFKRLSIFALTLVLTLGLLVVPALAACNHVCSVESGCITRQLTCGLEEHEHSMTNDPWCWDNLLDAALGRPTTCGKVEHTHTEACKGYVTVCKHQHDAECGYKEPDEPVDPEPEDPKPEQPAAPAGSNFIEPTYYADYEENVTYLDPEKAEAADYVVICRTLNVRKTPSTEFAPIAKIHRGDIVSVVDWVGDWAKIEWVSAEDGYAYVFGAYIEKL